MRCSVRALVLALTGVATGACAASAPPADLHSVGVAKIDITPAYPVRLSGFGFRRTESEGVTQRIWAKALAVGADDPAVLIAVENCGVPARITEEVAARLAKKAGVNRERVAVTSTHTHTAPMLSGVLSTLFGQPVPEDHQKHIERYTAELTDRMEQMVLAALAARRPSRLSWGIGRVGFAKNRRAKGGPVDHDLPVLVVRDLKGAVRAIYVNYACHCVTLSNNKISGDWAGFAQQLIEDEHPGAVALVSIGCGADANPNSGVSRDRVDLAAQQGAEVAAEVKRLLHGFLAPVTGNLTARIRHIELPLTPPTERSAWEARAQRKDAVGYHARLQLARLDRGETLPAKVNYPIQTWAFGDSLAMVFLSGEVVADYSVRLKREFDHLRLWVNAYANDVPAYIPSERVLKEGGYEGGGAMVYYDLPGPFKPGLEQRISAAVHQLLDPDFKPSYDVTRTGGSRAQSPQQSLAAIRTKKELAVELVAAEPLVVDPVAIDFGPDGRLWVAEMNDYPSGRDGKYQPGGRVRVLDDTDGDGKFDRATVFLENIPFPTGVTVWRKGVLVCAAPDILYAEDTDGDGKADVVKKLFSGFGTDNYQARVNSLEYGLDGWVYGSCGLFGGQITSFKGGKPVPLGDRDFRMKPDDGVLEPATGRTQQGRVRDDWGDWFGCDNTRLCDHYPLADHYLRRNPYVAPPATAVLVPGGPDPNRLYPARVGLQLFQLSGPPGRTTAACGLGIYRDDLLSDCTGDAFVCEPVNLLVHRLKLTPKQSTFAGGRAADETTSEFLASTDNWFRPVQVRTGPDGALWVVDMYRFVIEHPRWIPPEDLKRLDVRAGSAMGRIYRVYPKDHPPRPAPRLDKLDTSSLVAALDSPNGWQRDLAGQMLVWAADKMAAKPLEEMATASRRAEARLHALCVLDGLGQLQPGVVRHALSDQHPGVRRHAVRLSEKFLGASPYFGTTLLRLVNDIDAQVRLQLAYTLGQWHDPRAGVALATLALHDPGDEFLTAAVLSSVNGENLAGVLDAVFAASFRADPPAPLLRRLLEATAALSDPKAFARILGRVTEPRQGRFAAWQMTALAGLLDALQRRGQTLDGWVDESAHARVDALLTHARVSAQDAEAEKADRLAAIQVLGRAPGRRGRELEVLGNLLAPQNDPDVQSAALTALARLPRQSSATVILAGWNGYSPAIKSQALDALLSRDPWQRALLDAIARGQVPASQLDPARRQRLVSHKNEKIRESAAKLFAGATSADRQKVVRDYQAAAALPGDRSRGHALFAKTCAACHRLDGVGFDIGPNLAALANKTPEYLLTEILDPNKNVDSRYTEYVATTKAGRTFTGLLAAETSTSVTLQAQEGKQQVLLRSELEELSSTGKSLMPEGLEKDLSRQDLADLIAYLADGGQLPPAGDFAAIARYLLDDQKPAQERQALIAKNVDRAAEIIAAMTADMQPGTKEEYRRIPWIWRMAVAAGKQNHSGTLLRLLGTALPMADEPLRDWQAVVIGGGIINGISQQGVWPQERLQKIVAGRAELNARWRKALAQAAVMADNDKVPTGTRYDALRIVAMEGWDGQGERLAKYLREGTDAELQMGAISGLADVDAPQVPPLLLKELGHFSPTNRKLAVDALLRSDARVTALLDAIGGGKVKRAQLTDTQVAALRSLKNERLRERAEKVLPP